MKFGRKASRRNVFFCTSLGGFLLENMPVKFTSSISHLDAQAVASGDCICSHVRYVDTLFSQQHVADQKIITIFSTIRGKMASQGARCAAN